MTNRKLRLSLSIAAIVVLITTVSGMATTSLANQIAQASKTIYLPLVSNRAPTVTNFGVQIAAPGSIARVMKPLNVEWLRFEGPKWSEVQNSEGGDFNWDVESVRRFERALALLRQSASSPRVIMILTSSPSWATATGNTCAAIEPDHFDEYARFLETLARRYPTVKYFELGNEPDVDPVLVDRDSVFGCWGNAEDEFYGGRTYGEMLKVVYPAIKNVDKSIQVLNGGLLLDRPRDDTPAGRPARFIEGVFAAGAGSSFDIMSYHNYTYYNGTVDGDSAVDPAAIDWKARYLRDLMQQYGVAEKPLINSEGALLCYNLSGGDLDNCRDAQASMVGRLYARAARDRITAVTWYLLDSDAFHATGLVNSQSGDLRPAYHAFKHARTQIGGAQYLGTLDNQPSGVEGYRFQNGTINVTVFWSDQIGAVAEVPVRPNSTPRCTDRAGATIVCQNVHGVVRLPATSRPTYVSVP